MSRAVLRQRLEIADWPARRDRLGSRDDRIRVDAVVAIEIGERSGLAEMLHAQRARAMTMDRAEPAERRRMRVAYSDNAAMRSQVRHQPLDMRARMHEPALARALRGGPPRVQPIRRCYGEQPHVAAILAHQA